MGKHASNWQRDVKSMTIDLWGYRACRCGYSFSILIPSLKFVGLSLFRISEDIADFRSRRSDDLNLWPWNWCRMSAVGLTP